MLIRGQQKSIKWKVFSVSATLALMWLCRKCFSFSVFNVSMILSRQEQLDFVVSENAFLLIDSESDTRSVAGSRFKLLWERCRGENEAWARVTMKNYGKYRFWWKFRSMKMLSWVWGIGKNWIMSFGSCGNFSGKLYRKFVLSIYGFNDIIVNYTPQNFGSWYSSLWNKFSSCSCLSSNSENCLHRDTTS